MIMKKFILKSFIFFIPVLIYILMAEFFLFRIKEHLPLMSMIQKQQGKQEESFYGRQLYGNVLNIYKYNTMLERNPEVLILGQSIVLCFRDFYFKPYDNSFYNTGLMVRNVADLEHMTTQLLNGNLRKPKYILFGLDHSFVLENSNLDDRKFRTDIWEDPFFDSRNQLRAMQKVMTKSDIREVPAKDIGYGKKGMVGNGYRKDGSCNNKWEMDLFTKDSTHTEGILIEDFRNHRNGYPKPMNYDEDKASRVIKAFDILRNNNIEILVYISPLSDQFFSTIQKHAYVRKFWAAYMGFQGQLIAEGFNVIPFTTPSEFGLNDYYMLNSDHPGEIFVAKQFLKFYQNQKQKGPVSNHFDLDNLDSLIRQSGHPLSFQLEDSMIY